MYLSAVRSKGARAAGITTAAVAALALAPMGAATAAPPSACDLRTNNTYEKLLQCVSVDAVMEHQEAFQDIADANDGNRAAGTSGYTKSVDYVVKTLTAAGWKVSLDEFPFTYVPPPKLQQLTPVTGDYEDRGLHGDGIRRGRRQRHPRRHRDRPSARPGHQRLRGQATSPDSTSRGPRTSRSSSAARVSSASRPSTHRRPAPRPSSSSTRATHRCAPGPSPEPSSESTPSPRTGPRRQRELRRRSGPRRSRAPPRGSSSTRRRVAAAAQRHRRAARPQPVQRRHGRRPPRLGPGRSRHQRQRQRFLRPAGDRPADLPRSRRRTPCASRGGGPRRAGCSAHVPTSPELSATREGPGSPSTSTSTWWPRRTTSSWCTTVTSPAGTPRPGFRSRRARSRSRTSSRGYYTKMGDPLRRRPVQRSQRLPGVHPERHPGRWSLHRRRGAEDGVQQAAIWGGTAGAAVRPVLPHRL